MARMILKTPKFYRLSPLSGMRGAKASLLPDRLAFAPPIGWWHERMHDACCGAEVVMAQPIPYASSVAIQLPPEHELKTVIGDGYDSSKVLNVIKMMAGTEDMYPATVSFIAALFRTSGVSPLVREMIMLRAAKLLNSPYEWQANAVLAKNIGMPPAEIEAAATDGPVTGINSEYVLVCKATDELSMTATLSDETLTELLTKFGDTVTRKLILMIGWFNLLSRFLNGCRVPLEVSDKIGQRTSPLS